MKRCKFNLVKLIILFLIGCNQQPILKENYLDCLIEDYIEVNAFESYLLIIPPNACIPCSNYTVKKSIEIINKNYPVKILFQCFPENLSLFSEKLDSLNIKGNDVIVDTTLKLYNIDAISSPIIVYFKDQMINKIEFQNKDNPNAVDEFISTILKR